MLNDTWQEDYAAFVEGNSLTLCSGLAYRRGNNKLENAQQMNALIFDLDGVGLKEIRNLFFQMDFKPEQLRSLPRPTYVAASGRGIHIYYVLTEPLALFPNIKIQLKSLKYDLTYKLWNPKITSQDNEIQYQSINQAFRMVGSINDKYGTTVRAFRTGSPVSIEYLNDYVIDPANKVDINKPFKPSKMSRSEAKERYPEWYQRVVVEGDKRQKKWDIKSKQGYALYDWWKQQRPKIKAGHRYFYLMCLAIYACKCDVPKDILKADMHEALTALDLVENRKSDGSLDRMKQADIDSALEAYNKEYYNFTISDIEALTNIHIDRNKRNGRKQQQHLQLARGMRMLKREIGENVSGGGRPSKQEIVEAWQKLHPDGKKIDCHRKTGLSRVTIDKWWE